MNDIYQGKTKAGLPPIQIQPPSMGSVLDMLNIINGILFVQISQQDIENFKKEYDMRQKDGPPPKKAEITADSFQETKALKSDSLEKSCSPEESSQSPALEAVESTWADSPRDTLVLS